MNFFLTYKLPQKIVYKYRSHSPGSIIIMTNAAKDQGISIRKALHGVVSTMICSRYCVVSTTTLLHVLCNSLDITIDKLIQKYWVPESVSMVWLKTSQKWIGQQIKYTTNKCTQCLKLYRRVNYVLSSVLFPLYFLYFK